MEEKIQEENRLFVGDIMTKDVVSVGPETKITEVANLLFANRFHGVPVIENGKPIGIITEKDFFTKQGQVYLPYYIEFLQKNVSIEDMPMERKIEIEQLINTLAKDIMTKDCVTIIKDMKVSDLIEFFKVTHFGTLPVTDESGKMVGIVTLADILNLLRVR
jgi:acetoin utilization protein AcuB